ncbi:hypothetical protein [Humibacillus xanthopallidus]|nr:hypothetical protein [Humibacillus xanthopallidus]
MLSYGHLIALGGDFYGVGAEAESPGHPPLAALDPISSSVNPAQAFSSAYLTLVGAPASELDGILAVMNEEQAAIDAARKDKVEPSVAYEKLGDSLSYKWNEITGGGPASLGVVSILTMPGRYINLASVNMDHFGKDAVTAYLAGHGLAMTQAAQLHGQDPNSTAVQMKLLQAYGINAFADHFLTDLFAAGHTRTPRRALWATPQTIAGETGLLARAAHNEDNSNGLHVQNARGDTWAAYGDGKELDSVNAANFAMAVAATQASADEVYRAFVTGSVAPGASAAALQYVPTLDFSAKPVPGGPNYAPLFWADPENNVYRRGGDAGQWPDKNNYDYVYPFSDAEMVAQVKNLISGGTTTTSVACYLQKGSDVTWQWGLNADNSYYKLNGYWITTPHTRLQKFVTDTDEAEMMAAANRAIAYYNRTGYSVIGLFAADSSGGYNYPILVGESELYPTL